MGVRHWQRPIPRNSGKNSGGFVPEGDDETTRIARAVRLIGIGLALAVIPAIFSNIAVRRWPSVYALCAEELLVIACLVLNARKSVAIAARLLTLSVIALCATLQFVGHRGVHDVAVLMYPGTIIMAGALFERRWYTVFVCLAMGAYATQYTLELTGVVQYELSRLAEARLLVDGEAILAVSSVGVGLLMGHLRKSMASLRVAIASSKESESLYRSLFESVNEAILVHDISRGEIVDTNPRVSEMFGYSSTELRSLTIEELSSNAPGYAQSDALERIHAAAAGRPQVFEWQSRARDGRVFWVEVNMRAAVVNGAERVLVSLRDIDERKRAESEKARLEEQLRQAQKLESIGRLAGGIAHDFNNLLTCILGNYDLAASTVASGHPCRTYLQEIDHAARRAAELTAQLLAFSRKQPIAPRPIDLRDLLKSLHRMLQRLLDETIEVKVSLASDTGIIRADPGQIEQILVNLAVNARDAMPQGGRLEITAENVDVDDASGFVGGVVGQFVRLSVSDNGSGMSEDVLEHIFEPFFTTKPQGKGTGLGLPMVFGAIQQNNGFISVSSKLGVGTRFELYLPRSKGISQSLPAVLAPSPLPTGREHILLVEDDPAVRVLTERMLAHLGYVVTTCANAAEALTLVQTQQAFDLLVTDIILPDLDGKALAARLVEFRPSLKVLYVSGYTEDVIAHQGVVEEGLAFLGKPFTIDGLARKLRSVLEQT